MTAFRLLHALLLPPPEATYASKLALFGAATVAFLGAAKARALSLRIDTESAVRASERAVHEARLGALEASVASLVKPPTPRDADGKSTTDDKLRLLAEILDIDAENVIFDAFGVVSVGVPMVDAMWLKLYRGGLKISPASGWRPICKAYHIGYGDGDESWCCDKHATRSGNCDPRDSLCCDEHKCRHECPGLPWANEVRLAERAVEADQLRAERDAWRVAAAEGGDPLRATPTQLVHDLVGHRMLLDDTSRIARELDCAAWHFYERLTLAEGRVPTREAMNAEINKLVSGLDEVKS